MSNKITRRAAGSLPRRVWHLKGAWKRYPILRCIADDGKYLAVCNGGSEQRKNFWYCQALVDGEMQEIGKTDLDFRLADDNPAIRLCEDALQ